MNKLELDHLEFYHSIWFTVLVIILLGIFVFDYQGTETTSKIIKDNPIINNSTTNLICFFLIATIGVSHGSLDNYKGKKLLKFYSLKNSIIFYLSYILIALFIILLWKILPTTTLFIFLIIAAYHFGKEDSLNKIKKSNFKLLYYFSRGSIIIFAPLAFHANDTIEILKIISSDIFIEYLYYLEKYYFFTPFFAFTIYFCFLHSVRHIVSLSSELDKENIKKGLNIFLNKALPLSLITAILFIIALYFLLDFNQINEAIFKVIFIGLASLTFPHILLEYLLEKNEK